MPDNPYLATVEAATPANDQGANPYLNSVGQAQLNAQAVSQPPKDAADAVTMGPQVGLHPDTALPAIPAVRVNAKAAEDNATLAANPNVANFVAKSPVNATLTQNSLSSLAAIHDKLVAMFTNTPAQREAGFSEAESDFLAPIEQAWKNYQDSTQHIGGPELSVPGVLLSPLAGAQNVIAGAAYRRLTETFGKGPADEVMKAANTFLPLLGAATPEGAEAAIGELGLPGAKPVPPAPHPVVGGWTSDAEGVVTHPTTKEPVVFNTPKEAAQWTVQANKITPPGVRLDVVNGAEEGTWGVQQVGAPATPGVNPNSDEVFKARAEDAATSVAGVQEELKGNELHSLSPTKAEEFLEEHTSAGGQTAYVNAQALADLATQGHEPFPDLHEETAAALLAGREVPVPLSKYLTETAGQPFAEELNKATRFSEDGVSQEQAKDLLKGEGETKLLGNYYHGTDKAFTEFQPSEIGTFFTNDVDIANNYAMTHTVSGEGANVHKVNLHSENPYYTDTLAQFAWRKKFAEGYDAIVLAGGKQVIIRNTSQIRSVFAREPIKLPKDLSPELHEPVQALAARSEAAVDKIVMEHGLAEIGDNTVWGMTKPQANRYGAALDEWKANQTDKVLERAYRQIRHERTPEWKDQVARQRAAVEQELTSRRDIAARRELQYGEGPLGEPLDRPSIKLSKPAALSLYGQSTIDNLPGAMFRAVPDEAKSVLHPDDAAELLGYDSGDTLVHDLMNLETDRVRGGFKSSAAHLEGMIKTEAEARARAELGYDVSQGALEQAAREAITEPEITDLLTSQMKELAKLSGLPLDIEGVKEQAQQLFARMTVGDAAKPKVFVKALQQISKRVEAALEKGQWDKAFTEKQHQLTNLLQLKESWKLQKAFASRSKEWGKLAKVTSRPSIEQSFLDAIHGELRQYGFSVPRGNIEYRRALWEQEQLANGQAVIETPPIRPVPLAKLTVEEFFDLKNRIDNMLHLGKEAQSVIAGAKKEAMEGLVHEAVLGASNLKPKGISNEGVPKKSALSSLNAEFSQVQHLFDKLDDNNANGVFNRVFRLPAVAAHARKLALRAEDHAHIEDKYNGFSNVEKAQMQRNVPAGHGLMNPVTGQEMELKINDLIGMALNLGTELNKWHLTDGGWGWSEEGIQGLLDSHMTPKMIDFVQEIHQYLEKIAWPRIADHEFNSTGVVPEKPRVTGFKIGERELPGGYFPLVKDLERAPLMGTSNPDITALFKDKIVKPGTPTGFLQKRITAQYPVSLNWQDTLFHHVNDMTNRVAYSDYISSAMRFMSQQDIKQLLANYGGPNAAKMIMESLQRQTGVSLVSPGTQGAVAAIARAARKNFYLVSATMKAAILLEHATAVPQAMQVAGFTAPLDGYRRLLSNPMAATKFAWDSSEYLRGRHNEIDMNMRDLADDMDGKSQGLLGLIDNQLAKAGVESDLDMPFRLTKKGAMAVLNWVNHYTVAVPNWLGSYYAAIEGRAKLNGVVQPKMDHPEAVAFGDKTVSLAHGSGAEMDLSAVQSGFNEFFKLFNVYYNYHGNQFNLNKGGISRLVQGRDSAERAQGAFQFGLGLIATMLAGLVTFDQLNKLFGKKATMESRLGWVTDHVAGGLSREVPVAREAEQMRETWYQRHEIDFQATPFVGMPESIGKAMADVGLAAAHKKLMPNAIRDMITGASYLFGIAGGSQLGNTAQGLADLNKPDNVHPLAGVLFGPYAEKDHETGSSSGSHSRYRPHFR